MSFSRPYLLGTVFFWTALPYSRGYHLDMGGMPLHEAVGIIVKRAQLLNIKAQMSSIWAKGCMLLIVCVLSDLTWLPLLGGGRKSWYIITIKKIDSTFKNCKLNTACPWLFALAGEINLIDWFIDYKNTILFMEICWYFLRHNWLFFLIDLYYDVSHKILFDGNVEFLSFI